MATRSGLLPYRITVRQYVKMIGAGVFPEGAHVELLGGMLHDKLTKTTPHNFAVDRLANLLRRLVPPWLIAREEKSLVLGRYWRAEPDIAVVFGPHERYRRRDPGASDVGLLIEVADASYPTDRGLKWRRYAACGVKVYWIVNLATRRVEVYTSPAGRGAAAVYRDSVAFDEKADVPVVIEGREVGRIPVKDLLP